MKVKLVLPAVMLFFSAASIATTVEYQHPDLSIVAVDDRPVAAKRLLALRSETKILCHEMLIHLANINMFAGQPLTEITHDSNAARPTLIAIPLPQQLCGI